ncbi:MAG TPA: stage II sporulation protein M [Oscillospiraceae bacterium]|nr:stage II sporulation protein M [Oscillospiraceae bacterium]
MKRKRIIYHVKPLKIPQINYKPIVFFLFLFAGLIIGVICIKYGVKSFVDLAASIFEQARLENSEKGIAGLFFSSLLSSICFLFASFIIGLCAVGIPFLPIIPFIKGLYYGAFGGYMYCTYGVTGIGYCALIIYPAAAIMITALIYGCTESMMMSADICGILLNKTIGMNSKDALKMYCIRYAILILVLVLAAIVSTAFFKLFGSYFAFS